MESWKRNTLYAIILLGVALRIFYAAMSVDVADHYLNLVTAKSMRDCWCVPVLDMYGTAPLYRPPSSHFWLGLFIPYPKSGVLLFGFLLIGLTYVLARRLGVDREKALFATAVVAVTPIAVSFSSVNSLDVFTGVYTLSGLLFLLNERIFWTGVFGGLAFLSKYDGSSFVPIPAVYLALKRDWKHLGLYIAIVLLITLPWLLRMWHVFGNPLYPYFESLFGNSVFGSFKTVYVGGKVPLYQYLLGLPLTLFGVPEGDYHTPLAIAASWGIPAVMVWLAYLVTIAVIGLCMSGLTNFIKGRSPSHQRVVMLTLAGYGIFFLLRFFVPIGSAVFDLRYALALIPLLAIGVVTLKSKQQWTILLLFILGSLALYARFVLSAHGFQPFAEALEEVKKLPDDAVILVQGDSTVFSYGISYTTGRLSFPYLENPANLYAIPYLEGNYTQIRSRGPNYLWTTNSSIDCGKSQLFKNTAITICKLEYP